MPWDYPPEYGPWHSWFAWHPAKTQWHGWRWLLLVDRRQVKGLRTCWDYRPREKEA